MNSINPVIETFGDVVMYTFSPWNPPNPALPQEIMPGNFYASVRPLELLLEHPDKRVVCNVDVDVFDDYSHLINSYDGDRLRLSGHYLNMFGVLRRCLFEMIATTPEILWVLRTRHPENIISMVAAASNANRSFDFTRNVCLGVVVSNRDESDILLTSLLDLGSFSRLRMVEVEKLSLPIVLRCNPYDMSRPSCANKTSADYANCLSGEVPGIPGYVLEKARVDWVWVSGVMGDESASLLAMDCSDSGVPVLFRGWYSDGGEKVDCPLLSNLQGFPTIDLRDSRIIK